MLKNRNRFATIAFWLRYFMNRFTWCIRLGTNLVYERKKIGREKKFIFFAGEFERERLPAPPTLSGNLLRTVVLLHSFLTPFNDLRSPGEKFIAVMANPIFKMSFVRFCRGKNKGFFPFEWLPCFFVGFLSLLLVFPAKC